MATPGAPERDRGLEGPYGGAGSVVSGAWLRNRRGVDLTLPREGKPLTLHPTPTEAAERERTALEGADHAGRSVDERGPHHRPRIRVGEGPARHRLGAALDRGEIGTRATAVRPHHDVRVEDRHQGVEVPAAGGGEEGLHDRTLLSGSSPSTRATTGSGMPPSPR